jgi:L-ascorbate metabolism protein UlaG (beta-lactamase superfamily)
MMTRWCNPGHHGRVNDDYARPATTLKVTWWGHGTVLIEDGARVLTDPVLTARALHLRRRAGGTPSQETRDCDVVLISHLHADHLHLPSLALLRPGTGVLLPRGGAPLLRGLRLEAVEVSAGDTVAVGEARVTAVPATHSDRRWPWSSTRALAVGYLVTGCGTTYFAGDTVAFPQMATLHPHLDVALLPVGGWGPWLRGQHLDPAAAAACLQLLHPRIAVPIHYGTFWPRGMARVRPAAFYEPGLRFAAYAGSRAPTVDVRILSPGTSTALVLR